MFNLTKECWLGDEASLRDALQMEARVIAAAEARGYSAPSDAGDSETPRLYSRSGNVGVITVRGPLVNTENIFTSIFGVSTYPAIREALIFAAQDPEVSKVLLDIESPGGAVSGVNDTAKLVKRVDGIKPVTVFSDSTLASAAYWIASGARKINVGETAIVGSIGVIATMASQHEALKKEGVQVQVVRAGKNKALGHPAEPISDKAIAQVQERVDAMYGVFTNTVAANRAALPIAKKGTWAEGNEFMGADAVSAGLADKVSTFDETHASLVESVDTSRAHNNNADKTRGMQMKPRATLDPQLAALIQAGAQLNEEQKAQVEAVRAAEAAGCRRSEGKADADAATAAAAAAAEAEAKAKADAEAAAAAAAAAAAQAAPQAELVNTSKASSRPPTRSSSR
jgi:signal peptide peptidase SppA